MGLLRRRDGSPETDNRPDHPLVQECTAFLEGRLAELFRADGRAVPVWAMLNEIAHASIEQLQRIGATPGADTEVVIARAILGAVSSPEELRAVQAAHIVPIELRAATEVMSPRRAIELVTQALFEIGERA